MIRPACGNAAGQNPALPGFWYRLTPGAASCPETPEDQKMHRDRTSAAVPAYSKELLTSGTHSSAPAVASDCPADLTREENDLRRQRDSRIVSVCYDENGGGAAITTDDRRSPEGGIDIAVIPAYAGDQAMGGSRRFREGCL